jgi:hypothetical protein
MLRRSSRRRDQDVPPGRQLNIRVSEAASDRLEALAFLRRITAANLAREVLLEYLDAHADEPGLQGALKALAAHDAAAVKAADLEKRKVVRLPRDESS